MAHGLTPAERAWLVRCLTRPDPLWMEAEVRTEAECDSAVVRPAAPGWVWTTRERDERRRRFLSQ